MSPGPDATPAFSREPQEVTFDPKNANHLIIKEAQIQAARSYAAFYSPDFARNLTDMLTTTRKVANAWSEEAVEASIWLNNVVRTGPWKQTIFVDGAGKPLLNNGCYYPRGKSRSERHKIGDADHRRPHHERRAADRPGCGRSRSNE